jgi:hypothetical protein
LKETTLVNCPQREREGEKKETECVCGEGGDSERDKGRDEGERDMERKREALFLLPCHSSSSFFTFPLREGREGRGINIVMSSASG